jgi:hypothetical protein
MGKNVIFTICSKNYFAQAKVLAKSVKQYAVDTDFFILLADEINGVDIKQGDIQVIEAKTLNIPDYYEMAFKYDVIEYNTSIKPFFITKLFTEYNYEKVLYLDPDMALFDDPNIIFDLLDSKDIVLTPHLVKPYLDYVGCTSEEELLFVGIYNLGFIALKNSEIGRHVANWWSIKLKDQCYADKEDALHVDQKWMDFIPSLYTDYVKILTHPGVNHAFWNMHERNLVDDGVNYTVDGQKLVVFHFSGLNPYSYHDIAAKQTKFKKTLTDLPQYQRLYDEYVRDLFVCDYEYLSKLKYTYNYYLNDVAIVRYQRRLYRALLTEGKTFGNPFSDKAGSFYDHLAQHKLMIFDKDGAINFVRKNMGAEIEAKSKVLYRLLRLVKRVLGIKRYYLLMKFFSIHSRFENQTFLFK